MECQFLFSKAAPPIPLVSSYMTSSGGVEVEPVFSLVIPCFNESKSLPELIAKARFVASVGNGEIILVDNGSSDNSAEVLTRELKNDTRVRWVTVPVNKGYGHGILTGLSQAQAPVVGWTHADLQTDPADVLRALGYFAQGNSVFVKGLRFGRPYADRVFTAGMSAFETILLLAPLRDINAQPTLFSRELMEVWGNPPEDFSLDLFALVHARKNKFKLSRFPVIFAERRYGKSSWNVNFPAKWKFIKRTLGYSFRLRKSL